jgi:hypothetical protein
MLDIINPRGIKDITLKKSFSANLRSLFAFKYLILPIQWRMASLFFPLTFYDKTGEMIVAGYLTFK